MNLYIYVIRRLLYSIPILLGVCLIIFVIFNVASPDPTAMMLSKHATTKQMMEIRKELGLDRSLIVQYFDIVKSAFTFDFGRSWATRQKISTMITNGALPSLSLSFPAFFLATLVAIGISLLVSYFRGTMVDKVVLFFCVLFMSVSSLAYILLGQWFLAYYLGLFEISGYEYGIPEFIPYVLLPGIIWMLLSIGPDVRFYRTVILDEIYQDYVRTARAKGLGEKVILFKHVLKNAMIPIITYVVIRIPFLVLGALLLENFFGIPGLGGIVLDAINASDFPVIKAMTVLSAVAYIAFTILTDVLYTIFDPRVRLK